MAPSGTFSFVYIGSYAGDAFHAVDWDWVYKRQWARSIKDSEASSWDSLSGIDIEAYHIILSRCGLLNWQKEFSSELVRYMSPAQLAAARREKERFHNMGYLEIRSDTIGFRELAENVG